VQEAIEQEAARRAKEAKAKGLPPPDGPPPH